ncbi:MAG: molybdenum cofactor guanylyltransferase [Nibricoccus sp.]
MSDAVLGLTGVVMAGGLSSRMGRDKALLKLASGRTLLEQAVETLKHVGAKEVLVSVAHGKSYRLPGVREVADVNEDCGPIGGLAACVDAAREPFCLVLAVDLPAMTSDYLRGLATMIGEKFGVVPINDGSAEPLSAIYPKAALAEIQRAINERQFSLQRLAINLERSGLVRFAPVGAHEQPLFANWNSPEDCRL